ncbi:structural cement protein Gp24 [Thalassobius sp. S69A]|uniref:structural cement protein Gp24 n=1 Tax=unclassified Thalassovita TaxID=2619711 RepID=UPI003C7BDAEB
MAVQSTYLSNMAAAYAGMIVNTEPNNLISKEVEASGGIGFAVPVIQGTADGQCDEVSASTDVILGITVRDQSATDDSFAQYDSALVMQRGVLWVTVTDAGGVSAGDDVWVLVADGTFSNADAGTDGSIKINNARWETSAADGALAAIRFDTNGGCTAGAS